MIPPHLGKPIHCRTAILQLKLAMRAAGLPTSAVDEIVDQAYAESHRQTIKEIVEIVEGMRKTPEDRKKQTGLGIYNQALSDIISRINE